MRKSLSRLLANRNKAKLFCLWIRTREHISQVGAGNQFITLRWINLITRLAHRKCKKGVLNKIGISDASAYTQNQPTCESVLRVEL